MSFPINRCRAFLLHVGAILRVPTKGQYQAQNMSKIAQNSLRYNPGDTIKTHLEHLHLRSVTQPNVMMAALVFVSQSYCA